MKKILFVCSHLYSGSSGLCDALNRHPRIQGYNFASKNSYTSPHSLMYLTDQIHKCTNKAAIYMDELLKNHQLSTKSAYGICKFIYVLREPEVVLSYLIKQERIKPEFAVRNYLFRIRRMCEMSKRSGGILLTWNDLTARKGIDLIEDYLELKQKIPYDEVLLRPYARQYGLIDSKLLQKTEDAYQKYLYWIKTETKLKYL